jgi:hypothetical protein
MRRGGQRLGKPLEDCTLLKGRVTYGMYMDVG